MNTFIHQDHISVNAELNNAIFNMMNLKWKGYPFPDFIYLHFTLGLTLHFVKGKL